MSVFNWQTGLTTSSALTTALKQLSQQIRHTPDRQEHPFIEPNATAFIEANVYDPETGALLQVYPEQRAVIEQMTHRTNGAFDYSTWLWSQPKKSGKTTICAGLALWWAWQIPNGQVYVIGNDQKQADSRLFRVIEYAIKHHPVMQEHAKIVRYKIELSNGTIIEALPIDPTGEAGSNPTAIIYTEAWGLKGTRAELMWSEMALSPTRKGQAFKLVESYAGHKGVSTILERQYNAVVRDEYLIDAEREIYANPDDGIIGYWCTRRVMPWQNGPEADAYYREERRDKTSAEFDRQHNNAWSDSQNAFVSRADWDDCIGQLPDDWMDRNWVLGVDAAVSSDSFSMVAVFRDGNTIYVAGVWVWYPPEGGKLRYDEPEAVIRDLVERRLTDTVVYDPCQLHDMMNRMHNENLAWFKEFQQGAERLRSDKRLRDLIINGNVVHTGDPELTSHVLNADAKTDTDKTRLRIVKRQESKKVDAAVALSMAAHIAMEHNL